jgi:predicted DNA-binding transcriptional regulator YafY
MTKPIHTSQQLIREDAAGIEISIRVVLNKELEREILAFGENMKVLSPATLAERMRKRFEAAAVSYAGPSAPLSSDLPPAGP